MSDSLATIPMYSLAGGMPPPPLPDDMLSQAPSSEPDTIRECATEKAIGSLLDNVASFATHEAGTFQHPPQLTIWRADNGAYCITASGEMPDYDATGVTLLAAVQSILARIPL